MIGSASPATTYTAAQLTIATEIAGRTDHPTRPTRPDRRAAQTCAGIKSGRSRNPPPMDAMSNNVTMPSVHLAKGSIHRPARIIRPNKPDRAMFQPVGWTFLAAPCIRRWGRSPRSGGRPGVRVCRFSRCS